MTRSFSDCRKKLLTDEQRKSASQNCFGAGVGENVCLSQILTCPLHSKTQVLPDHVRKGPRNRISSLHRQKACAPKGEITRVRNDSKKQIYYDTAACQAHVSERRHRVHLCTQTRQMDVNLSVGLNPPGPRVQTKLLNP